MGSLPESHVLIVIVQKVCKHDTAPQPVLKFTVSFNGNDEETTVSSELQIYSALYNFYICFYLDSRNKDEITLERIGTAKVIIFGGPRRKFTANEVNNIFK